MPEFTGRLRTPRLASAPASPVVGEMYYDTATNKLYWWNGSAWVDSTGGIASSAGVIAESGLPARLKGDATASAYVASLDTVFENGWYRWDTATTGRPADWYGMCQVINLGSGNIRQFAYRYDSDASWMRRKNDAGAFGAWQTNRPIPQARTSVPSPSALPFAITISLSRPVAGGMLMVHASSVYANAGPGAVVVGIGIDGTFGFGQLWGYNDISGGGRRPLAPCATPNISLASGNHNINFRNDQFALSDGGDYWTIVVYG